MGEARHDGLAVPGHVILAHELPFHLGDLYVTPPTRQVESGDQHETLEPRVMQVLVALARAGGGILTRDELIETCWDGRVVGEDSINRVLSRIRRLAGGIGRDSFAVETIARVGYRLVATNADQPAHDRERRASTRVVVDRRLVIGGAAALALLAVGGAAVFWPDLAGGDEPSPRAKSLFDQAAIIRQENNRQALAYLREAVRLSPEYGEAWGALALTYRIALNEEAPERVAGFEERLQEAIRNAEQFNPGNADAAVALLPTSQFGQWSSVEPLYRSAIRRHPDHVAGYALLGNLLMDVGRWSDAVVTLRAAKSRNPSSAVLRYKLIVSLWAAGRISAAEDEIDEAMKLWPQHGAIWQTKIKILSLTGRPAQAHALASDPAAKPLDEDDAPNNATRLLYLKALATRESPDTENAVDAMIRQAREVEGDRVSIAINSAALGRIDLALDLLDGVYLRSGEWARSSAETRWLAAHPLFQPHARPLWREPRFHRILQAVGLERYWRTTGTLPDYRRSAGT